MPLRDSSRMPENTVQLEALSGGYRVSFRKVVDGREIDFGETVFVQ